ncbi:hypothetical protein [Salimicrobium halophilum]|uniref:DUF4190 domain-containing protein n=1 Tax=Salimicrobium halophilum TaxID=86666 RepID=A0A1G8PRK2_9BACI|nr:hypothetical protein [Salimicrobium halophilum]SDI95052.1 hypothetical protein SAMN04490247_0150 [Salimicrobium halophilum]
MSEYDEKKDQVEVPPEHGDREENTYDTEAAQEAEIYNSNTGDEPGTNYEVDSRTGMAWLGLTAAVLSYFLAPFLLAAGGLILGVIGFRRGGATVGAIAIGLSIASLLFSIFFPMMTGMFRMM